MLKFSFVTNSVNLHNKHKSLIFSVKYYHKYRKKETTQFRLDLNLKTNRSDYSHELR